MTDKKLNKAVKEVKEACQAVKEYVKYKISNLINYLSERLEDVKIAISQALDSIKHFISNLYYNIVKYIKIVAYSVANYSLRALGAIAKLPVYILNNAAILGNILQMRANYFKTKVEILREPKIKSQDK